MCMRYFNVSIVLLNYVVWPFVLFLLTIILSVLRFTDSDCYFWYLQILLGEANT